MRLDPLDSSQLDPSHPDHRRSLDTPITVLKAENGSGPKTFFGYAKNISRSGMLIGTTNPREVGSRFRLEIPLPAPINTVVTCECEVIWQRRWAKNDCHEPGMGLRFIDLPEEVAAAIDRWIDHCNQRQMLWN